MDLQLSWGSLQTRGDEWKAREAQKREKRIGGSLGSWACWMDPLTAGG